MNANLGKIALAGLLAVFFGGCDLFEKKQQASQVQQQMPPAQVDVIAAKKANNPMSFEYPARLESTQDVVLTPKVSGTLTAQNFKAGDYVKQGDVLFVIEKDKFNANYEVAKATIAQAQASLKSAKNEVERVKKLYSQSATSQKEYDAAVSNYENAAASLASAKANAKLAELDLEYSEVKAPFSGVVGENLVDVGAYVSSGSAQLVRLSKTDVVEARFYIADSANLDRISNLENSTWVQLDTNATLLLNGEKFSGNVKFIDNLVDTNTGSVLAKAEFKNDSGKLLPGSFAKILMDGFMQKDSFLLPQIAIKQDTTSAYVLVAKDGKVAKKPIKIAYQTSMNAIVSSGIDDGDLVILNNFSKIGVGAPVNATIKDGK